MKTFAIKLGKEIAVNGVLMPAGYQVAAITGEVDPMTLLGLIQFHHAEVEEVTDADDGDEDGGDDSESDSDIEEDEPVATSDAESEVSQDGEQSAEPQEAAPAAASFLVDGLDEKIAKALESNGVNSPDDVRKLIAEGFDLTELEDIGEVRAKKILEIYK